MSNTHYHIVGNTPGYLPEGDPITTSNLALAQEILQEEMERYIEGDPLAEDADRYTVEGSVEDGYFFISDSTKQYDLGYTIEIQECDDPACGDPETEEGEPSDETY